MATTPIELVGSSWDAVRAARLAVLGTEEFKLKRDNVPPELREVLPLAALLGVGEEGLFDDLHEAMDEPARELFWRLFLESRDDIQEFVTDPSSPRAEQYAFLCLVRFAEAIDS